MFAVDRKVARERILRKLMADKAKTGYKFKNPKRIADTYANPSPLDQGQSTIAYIPDAGRKPLRRTQTKQK